MKAIADRDLISLVTNKTFAVYDYDYIKALRKMPWKEWFENEQRPLFCREQYLEMITHWILNSKLNTVRGLEKFKVRHLISGTTQTFDEAYFQYRNLRLRIYRGEYAYHRRIIKTFRFIEDEPLAKGDYIIMSFPFCSTGSEPENYQRVLDQARDFNIPVLLDCAYFGTCAGLTIDLSHPAIVSASFSLTKGLGLGDIRSGIRFSNEDNDDPIAQQNRYNHTVLCAARIGLYMMELFSADHIPQKFGEAQKAICRELHVQPSPCMHLAIGGNNWDHFKVDEKYNRLGIRDLVKARFQGKI